VRTAASLLGFHISGWHVLQRPDWRIHRHDDTQALVAVHCRAFGRARPGEHRAE